MPDSQAARPRSADLGRPFVLFDDASGDGRRPATLFVEPVETIVAMQRHEVAGALERLADAERAGMHVAGYIGYEAGHALEARLASIPERPQSMPLLWFGLFARADSVDPIDLLAPVSSRPVLVGPPRPRIDFAEYAEQLQHIERLLEAGDIYQVNLTFPADVDWRGHPLAIYARLRRTQRMAYGAVVSTGREWLLSASPELFFALQGSEITAKPMKGTAARLPSPPEDQAAAAMLAADVKNRAENLMITDLIRNDLSRIAAPGSVIVADAFAVERYPTVHQMTTTIGARLRCGLGSVDIIKALFPCGSVTGAPKIRAIEVIDAIEARPRGAYTGSIGWIAPGGDTRFNVAIRTIAIAADGTASMGVGSGIVIDSNPSAEWLECMQKLSFVSATSRPFHLFETMAFDPLSGIALLDLHLDRLTRSAAHHLFAFDRHDARNLLQAVIGRLKSPTRVKLTLAPDGAMAIACAPLPVTPAVADVRIVPLPVSADDWRLYHKSSDRTFYDEARRRAGSFEVVFERPDRRVTEGSIANIFVDRGGALLTPPVNDGLLGGVLRQSLIDSGRASEASLTRDDLKDGFLLGNAVRGLFAARLVD